MNIKIYIFSLLVLIVVNVKAITQEELLSRVRNAQENGNPEESLRRYGASNQNMTSTTPLPIQHWIGLVGQRNFYRRRIFFGKDKDGNPLYQSIAQHEKSNPEFGNVTLAIFHKAAWYKLRFSDTFEVIGTYSDESARKKLINSMTPYLWENYDDRGGMWYPEQNAIIGGTQDPKIGKLFEQYLKEQKEAEQSSGQSKVKKI